MSKRKAIAFVAALWLLSIVLTAAAKASTQNDALKVAWYLKGEGDAVLPASGFTIVKLDCRPTKTKYVVCAFRLKGNGQLYCPKPSRFYIKGFAVVGQLAPPRPCVGS